MEKQRKPKTKDQIFDRVESVGSKPGVETSYPHISTMFASGPQGNMAVAESVASQLFPHLRKRVCVAYKERR